MTHRRTAPCVIATLFFCTAGSATFADETLRPVVLSSEHNHDRFVTQPSDLVLNFRAYTASFDTADDDDGNGEADLLGVPQWVSYQMNAGSPVVANERPEDWLPVDAIEQEIRRLRSEFNRLRAESAPSR